MVFNKATTVSDYLRALPADRRAVVSAVRKVIRANLPKGFREVMNWGMIAYEVPLARCPDTYNGKPLLYAAIAAQKHYFSIYLMCAYMDVQRLGELKQGFKQAGKRLDMGKSCIRFRNLEDLPLDAIGKAVGSMSVDEFVGRCEALTGRR